MSNHWSDRFAGGPIEDDTAETEREAIVAWLRRCRPAPAYGPGNTWTDGAMVDALRDAADAIERGDHLDPDAGDDR